MENKYYIPDISEFHVGLEIETRGQGLTASSMPEWKVEIVDKDNISKFVNAWLYPTIRVKSLDKDDIESMGFEIDELHPSMMSDENPKQIDYMFNSKNNENKYKLLYLNWWIGDHNDINEYRLVRIQRRSLGTDDYNTIFSGYIKNKSELKQVLKMIGYEL